MAHGGTVLTFEAECKKCGFQLTVPTDVLAQLMKLNKTEEDDQCRINLPKLAPEFIKKLENHTVIETLTVTLACELSKSNQAVQWLKDGQPVSTDDRLTITADDYTHQLIIRDLALEDAGNFLCVCGDVSTQCTVVVKGKIKSPNNEQLEVREQACIRDPPLKRDRNVLFSLDIPEKPGESTVTRDDGADEGNDSEPGSQSLEATLFKSGYQYDGQLRDEDDVTALGEGETSVRAEEDTKLSNIDTALEIENNLEVSTVEERREATEELAPELIKKLKNHTVKETLTVTLACELSKSNQAVQWLKDGQPVSTDDRLTITADDYTHQLIIRDLALEDAGNFLCVCGDVSTQCTVVVKERVPEFIRKLENQSEKETGTVTLKCQLSMPNMMVEWIKAGRIGKQ